MRKPRGSEDSISSPIENNERISEVLIMVFMGETDVETGENVLTTLHERPRKSTFQKSSKRIWRMP